MNKQKKYKAGELVSRGIEWTDYTWNPIAGCMHDCKWIMPDGNVASCYAKAIVEGGRVGKIYPQGFEHHYFFPARLEEPKRIKDAARIFVDSMSDLMGINVPAEQIQQVIDVMRDTPQHTYQVLTKNAPRLLKFEWPKNVWVGVSTPPSYFMGKKLTVNQQISMFRKTAKVLRQVQQAGIITWISAEPLPSQWLPYIVFELSNYVPDWVVIGAASNGRQYFPPRIVTTESLVNWLDKHKVPVFFKGNLKSLEWATENWHEEFPL